MESILQKPQAKSKLSCIAKCGFLFIAMMLVCGGLFAKGEAGSKKNGTTINAALPTEAYLDELGMELYSSESTITIPYNKAVSDYSRAVGYKFITIKIKPRSNLNLNAITINSVKIANNGSQRSVTLAAGVNVITIVATSEDKKTKKTYTITIDRAAPPESVTYMPYMRVRSVNSNLDEDFVYAGADTAHNFYHYAAASATSATIELKRGTDQTLKVNGVEIVTRPEPIAVVELTSTYTIANIEVTAYGLTKTYTLTIDKSGGAAFLDMLNVDGTDKLTFNSVKANYAITVPYSQTEAYLNAQTSLKNVSITVNGSSVANNTDKEVPVAIGDNTIEVTVTSESGTTKTYTIVITRPVPPVSATYITDISVASNLGPNYLSAIADTAHNWNIFLPSTATSVHLLIGQSDVKVNGIKAYRQEAFALTSVYTVFDIEVNAFGLIRHYTLTVDKTGANGTYLTSIKLNVPADVERVNTDGKVYTTTVPFSTDSVRVLPVARENAAVIKVNGAIVASGGQSALIALSEIETVINAEVTSPNGLVTEPYTIIVKRTGSNIARLSNLILADPAIPIISHPTLQHVYTASLLRSLTQIRVVATAQDANATIKINGTVVASGSPSALLTLKPGATVITILVTAENGVQTETYSIILTRPLENNTKITMALDPVVALKKTTEWAHYYATSVAPATTSVRITPTAVDTGATISIAGNIVASGQQSGPIALGTGETLIPIVVTAYDGHTIENYKITVSKNGSNNTYLPILRLLKPGTTLVKTSTSPKRYTASVAYSASTIQVFAKARDSVNAQILLNGSTPLASGVASAPLPLSVGANEIQLRVTAQDGVTVETYYITVNRAAAPPTLAAINNRQNNIDVLQKQEPTPGEAPEQLLVKQAVSPNGDGINDRLTITGINYFPENTVRVMRSNGDVVYEAKGYNNESKAFDGRSSKGTLQQAGTYFYSIEYKDGSEVKRKTGYIVLKY